jgi:RNA-directed DNA polymerase
VVEFLAERGLVLSPEKTKITHIREGFDFLGWNIRQYDGKLLMKPSKANVKAHLDKIREVIKANKTAKQANLIRLLNPILRGWANYHSHVVAKETFARVDTDVWWMLWRWAVRRHPNKGARWVKEKYFKTRGARNWVFAVTEKQEDGTQRELTLLQESDTPIQRHIKIRANANPHDPEWEHYFESRWATKMQNSSKGRAKFYRVWRGQDGMCSTCQEPITKGTP